jgi:hypothetical protein
MQLKYDWPVLLLLFILFLLVHYGCEVGIYGEMI